jgi:hypothetical protein
MSPSASPIESTYTNSRQCERDDTAPCRLAATALQRTP